MRRAENDPTGLSCIIGNGEISKYITETLRGTHLYQLAIPLNVHPYNPAKDIIITGEMVTLEQGTRLLHYGILENHLLTYPTGILRKKGIIIANILWLKTLPTRKYIESELYPDLETNLVRMRKSKNYAVFLR